MLKTSEINNILNKNEIPLSGETICTEGGVFYAFVKISFNSNQKQNPSSYRLNQVATLIKSAGATIYFVHVNSDISDLDSGMRSCLFENFPSLVRNSFLSIDSNRVNIWVEPKITLNTAQLEEISALVKKYLKLFKFDDIQIYYTQSLNIPTSTAILKTLRIISPSSLENISNELSKKDLVVPNLKWLNHAIDRLRKAGDIVRLGNKQYILSLKGLRSLGTEKSRASPDIKRILALGKKGT